MLSQLSLLLAFALSTIATPIATNTTTPDTPCPPTVVSNTKLVGNGNPHQNYIFKQVSGTTDCTGNPGGSASVTNGQSVSWGFTAGAATDFITGGFDVSTTVSTGYTNGFGCEGHTGSLCVFERIQVTAYTVEGSTCTESCTEYHCTTAAPSIMYAPNTQQGSCFYSNFQALLPCDGLDAEHYVKNGPAGGPQYISCEQVAPA